MSKAKREKCEAKTPICSGSMVRRYSVNGSEKAGYTFPLCGPCKVYLGRTAKITEAKGKVPA